jgi:hypothetical protein
MQIMEFSKGSGSAIGLSLAPDSADAFAKDLRQVKMALLEWRAKHGGRCEMVMLTVVSAPEIHPAIESLIEQVYQQESELAPLLQTLSVQVALLNQRGKPVKEYSLGKPTAELTKPKPWWRFW